MRDMNEDEMLQHIVELEKRVDKAMGLLGGILAVIGKEFGPDKIEVIISSVEKAVEEDKDV